MNLKFDLGYWQVPRSSVGRASDRTMLRSVVRVQTLARGILSFLFLFLSFSSYCFPFPFFVISLWCLNTRLKWVRVTILRRGISSIVLFFFFNKCMHNVVWSYTEFFSKLVQTNWVSQRLLAILSNASFHSRVFSSLQNSPYSPVTAGFFLFSRANHSHKMCLIPLDS